MRPFERPLGDGLVLRTLRSEADVDGFAALHGIISAAEQITCAYLPRHHPATTFDDYLVVEDTCAGQIVSTTCLLPWRWRYEQLQLNVAMLEMVVTHPDYRQRGLVRAQIERFHQVVAERGYDLSVIEGIPYYYRQYGYAYAVDHYPGHSLPAWRAAEAPPASPGIHTVRQATPDDAATLAALYAQAMAPLDLITQRDATYWRFLLEWARYPAWLVERGGQAVGYLVVQPGSRGPRVLESGIRDHAAALAALHHLRAQAAAEIQIVAPPTDALLQLAQSLGSAPLSGDQWLIRLRDPASFLTAIGPALERRLAASIYAGLTADLILNLFRRAYRLGFCDGKLAEAQDIGFVDASLGADGGDLCIPPDAFVRLALGYRSLSELRDAWPDIVVKPARRHLWEALFPPMRAYLSMPYLYCGPTQ